MATNNRIYYAIQQVKLGFGDNKQVVHGLQSAGITTNFNLEQVFEMGQLAIYQNVENIPEIEVTLNKVLDGAKIQLYLKYSMPKLRTENKKIISQTKNKIYSNII